VLILRFKPEGLERLRFDRVSEALQRKCRKLAAHKGDRRETVLVLESDDTLGDRAVIGDVVSEALTGRDDTPDHVFLVETAGRPWYIWTLKEGTDVYPSQRLLDQDPVEF
jgi:hypothetical protein